MKILRLICKLVVVAFVAGLDTGHAANFVRIGANPMSGSSAFPSVHALKAFNGRLYFGYGDWNEHPSIVIGSYVPAIGRYQVEHLASTDSIGSFKEINGKLYVPHMDPVHHEDFKDYSWFDGGTWRDAAPLGLLHVFDMATLTGTDLWCVGSRTDYSTNGGGAAVYRSLDGGRNWEDKTLPTSEGRYYYCYVRNGKLYVRDTVYDENGTGVRTALASSTYLSKTRTIQVGTNQLVLALDTTMGLGFPLTSSAGIFGTTQSGFDFAWDGVAIYVLKADGIYRRVFPYLTNETFVRLPIEGMPSNPRSMEVLDGVAYVADALGVLWGARLDGGTFTPPAPATGNDAPDEFGRGLAVDGNTVAVGSPGQFVGNMFLAGQVTLWEYTESPDGNSNWIMTATIDPPVVSNNGQFGRHVALAGDVLAVVEAGRDTTRRNRGASALLHVYQRTSTNWVRRHSLDHPFAHSVAISGDYLVVGYTFFVPQFSGSQTPRVMLYRINRTNDVVSLQQATFFSAGGLLYEPVIRSVLDGNLLAYGASGDVSRLGGQGRVTIEEQLPTGQWMRTKSLSHSDFLPSGTNVLKPDRFGFSLALKNGWLAVGAPRDDESAPDAGAVYLYQRVVLTNGGFSFIESQKLLPPEPHPEGAFGTALAMTGTRLFVGNPGFDEADAQNRGRVYAYERDGSNWVLIGQMQRPSASTAEFGIEVAADENWMVAGSRFSNGSSNLTDRVAMQPHLSPYAMWAAYHGLEGTGTNPATDSDSDGADNGAEYAYRLNPRRADALPLDPQGGTSGLPSVRWVQEEAGTFIDIIRLQHRHPALMGLSYVTEVSTDLLNWAPAEVQSTAVTSINDEWERVTLRFAGRTTEAQLFYRLKAGVVKGS